MISSANKLDNIQKRANLLVSKSVLRRTPTKSHQCCGCCPSFQILILSVLFNACINVCRNNNDGNLNLIIFSLSYNNWLVFEIINVSSHLAAKK